VAFLITSRLRAAIDPGITAGTHLRNGAESGIHLSTLAPTNYSSGKLMNISIILAHPNLESFNHAIATTAAAAARA
jgi:hypothetical protein